MNPIPVHPYQYSLPPEKIAHYPLEGREESKLLFFDQGRIAHHTFLELPTLLPKNAFLFFNNTKVIPARILFKKDSGAEIETFLLQPLSPSTVVAEAMTSTQSCEWKCAVGQVKRWKEGVLLRKEIQSITLSAALVDRKEGIVRFTWDTQIPFSDVLTAVGATPLPPYLHRDAEPMDRTRYQTVYSQSEGAVAAPTAGLHFTDRTMAELTSKGLGMDFFTLHVSAGTFQPIKTENAADHVMHQEEIVVTQKNIRNLLNSNSHIVSVGTTSLRTMESVYWYGAKLLKDPDAPFVIEQGLPYVYAQPPSREDALNAVLEKMEKGNMDILRGTTSLFIVPGYTFRLGQALITNFHQPGSTLLLLIAAFIGEDWKKVYQEALDNNYRFLSYGDSSLLLPGK